jgi:hypothetical protein
VRLSGGDLRVLWRDRHPGQLSHLALQRLGDVGQQEPVVRRGLALLDP